MRQNRSRKCHLSEFETNASANIFAIFNENCFCGNAFSQVLCNRFGVPENVAFVTLANDGKIAILTAKSRLCFRHRSRDQAPKCRSREIGISYPNFFVPAKISSKKVFALIFLSKKIFFRSKTKPLSHFFYFRLQNDA